MYLLVYTLVMGIIILSKMILVVLIFSAKLDRMLYADVS